MEPAILVRPEHKKTTIKDAVDQELVDKIVKGLEDAKHGRIRRVA